ncbi:hypothetical protein DD238_002806 [Peronospora effusa]|uniref:RxLR effector PexRD54 WY domain-containing protein n=1 Tax=Peronospora effusa TaxID=542832 RepID=A0A3M6VTJ0_9STRA|nr:hypothetical protein DD238_002806 [Peronospora effusa]
MRVYVQLFLAAVAITHTTKAEPTPFVGVSKNNSSTESSSTAAKTTTFATGSPTKPSEEVTYTAGRDDGERMFERLSEMVEKAKDAVRSKLGNVVAKTDIVQPEGYETFSEVATKHQKDSVSAFAELKKKFGEKNIAQLIVYAKTKSVHNGAVLGLKEAQMEYWLKNKISSHDAFGLLGLNEVKDGLASPFFDYWITYVRRLNKGNTGESKIVFDILMSEYGDVALARLIVNAKKGSKPKIDVLGLEEAQIKYWLEEKKKSVNDVFVLLELNKADDNLLTHPLFSYWSTYVKRVSANYHQKKLSVVDILTPKYYSDVDLARLIVAAKKGSTPNDAVLELEKAQMEYWLNNKISSHDAFGLLKLNNAEDGLASPLFSYWITYVKRFNKGNAGESKSVFDILMSEFGDVALARLIVNAKKGSTPNIAVLRLEKAQMKYWLKEKKKSVNDVFVLLKLNKADENLLTNPLFPYWSTYVERFNKDNAGVRKSVLDILMLKYGNEDLARLIVNAKKGSTPNIDVLGLEKAQMDYWLNNKISAYDVFVLLKLNKADDNLLTHPLFPYWSTYVERFNKDNAGVRKSVFDILMPKYGDEDLAHLIVNAKKNKENEEINKNAVALGEEQLNYWLRKGESIDEVFELLRLHTVEDGVLTNPVFNQWYSYFEMVNKKHGNKESVIDFLSSKKGTSFEDFMKDELEKANLETKSRVDELFVDLRLERVGDGLFTDPLFIFWRACLEKFNAAHPKNPRTSVIQSLRTVYGDKGLVDLINAERKVTDSVKYASRLEEDLCATWLSDGKSLDDVFELLDLNRAGYKLLEDPSMKTFARFTQVASMDSKELPKTKEASFEENEILRGIKIASSTGELESTDSEIALLRLWFTQKKDPKEVYKMYFGKHNMRRILKKKGNLFEIPLFITFVKYSEGYSRTKRLATDDEAIETNEDKLWGTDPTYMVKCVDREFSMPLLLQDQFADKMDKLGEMIMSVKESSSNSVKASSSKPMKESSSKSTLFAVKRVEVALFHFWNRYVLLNDVFKKLQLNTEMTPAELFGNPSFRWWIDYADYLFEHAPRSHPVGKTLAEVFKLEPLTNLAWLRNARLEENTKEFADRVWSNLLKEHLQANTNPKIIKTELMIPPKSFHDEKDVKEYKHLYDRKINDAREKMKGDVKAWKTNTKLQEAKRKKLEEEELHKMEQEMKTKREED